MSEHNFKDINMDKTPPYSLNNDIPLNIYINVDKSNVKGTMTVILYSCFSFDFMPTSVIL